MASLIEELAELLRRVPGMRVEHQPGEMLVTLDLAGGRSQVVRASTQRLDDSSSIAIRFQSRACIAQDHRIVRRALRQNAKSIVPGLGLDTSVSPNVVDVVYSILADGVAVEEFVDALQRVAFMADSIEAKVSGDNRF